MEERTMLHDEIIERLHALQDAGYHDFQAGLIPGVPPEAFIGVRTPELRAYAKALLKRPDVDDFLAATPHRFFDENQLHAFILSGMKDYGRCVAAVNAFLPFVDNWATCDQMSPKVFKRHRAELLEEIKKWIISDHTYTVRFAIGMLMEHFLDDDFEPVYLEMVAAVRSAEYYVNMMIAWYFATALAKQWDAALPYIEQARLAPWTHNRAIQKAIESNRIPLEKKDYVRTLKVKKVEGRRCAARHASQEGRF